MHFRSIVLGCAGTTLLCIASAFAGVTAPAHVDTSGVNKQPAYPATALAGREGGAVVIGASIRDDGSVKKVSLVQSSGYNDLDSAAANAVNNWKFVPALENGNSIDSTIKVQIVFTPPPQ